MSKGVVNPVIYTRYKRKTYKGKRTNATRLSRLERNVRNLKANVETKFIDTTINDAVIAIGGTLQGSITIIPQGDTESSRTGRDVTIKSIFMHISIDINAIPDSADAFSSDTVRIIVFVDKQTNGSLVGVTSILETAVYNSFRNLNNSGRFIFLYDKFFVINRLVTPTDGTNTNSSGIASIFEKVQIINKNIILDYTSTSGALSEMTSNSIGVLYISRLALSGVENFVRVRYTDS